MQMSGSIKRTVPLFSLADQLFNEQTVSKLSKSLKKAHRSFDEAGYRTDVLQQFPDLELKERISALVDGLESRLPDNFVKAVQILEKTLPPPLNPELTDDDFGEFVWCVPAEYVARHGVSGERLETSLAFLREATKRFSGENAIRPFLAEYPEETMTFIWSCTTDDNYHVRRLASEGIRPLLPWARKVVLPTETILDVLTSLHADNTRYVTRSVANNVNDLSKSDPDLVLDTLGQWRKQSTQSSDELEWMIRHGLRTMVKQGHPQALEFLGYPSKPVFSVSKVSVSDVVQVGDSLLWRGELTSRANQSLKIGLQMHFLRADGSHSTKLFAVADRSMEKGESLLIEKSIGMKPLSTRTLYTGIHHVELVVNGVHRTKKSFDLKER